MDADKDEALDALRDFINQEKKVVTNELRDIIKDIAKKGRYIYQWEYLKPLFAHELDQVMDNFLENFPPKNANGPDEDKIKELNNERISILKTFNNFTSAPFTIQRLSELIIQPRKHYKTCAKFFRGLHKNLLVVSTLDPEDTEDTNIIELDTDESPSKRMRLEDDRELGLSTSNEGLLPDLKGPLSTDSKDNAVINGVENGAKLTEESEIKKSNEDFDMTTQEVPGNYIQTEDKNSSQTDVLEPDDTQKPEQKEECNIEQKKILSAECEQGMGESKDEAGNVSQNMDMKNDLSHIDTPL